MNQYATRLNSPEHKKLTLLELAKRPGYPRPNQRRHPLGAVLSQYTSPTQLTFDPLFDQKVRRLRPDWFAIPQELGAYCKKAFLLQMAAAGEKRPQLSRDRLLAISLDRYTSISDQSYDPEFLAALRDVRPDWFYRRKRGWRLARRETFRMRVQARRETFKKRMLRHAVGGRRRPNIPSAAGREIARLLKLDPLFRERLQKLRPDWFYRGPPRNRAPLTPRELENLRAKKVEGATYEDLAKKYGVSPTTIWRVIHKPDRYAPYR